MDRGGSAAVDQHSGRQVPEAALTLSSKAANSDSTITVAQARLAPPKTRADIVERDRLYERLDAGVHQPLTVVTAPPGAGKTVLVSSWAQRRAGRGQTAWLSIDRGETEAVQVWRSLVDAMQMTGEPEVRSLAASLPVGEPGFLAEFANALTALTDPLVIVLDDFHELRAPEVSEQLDSLLRHAPEKLRLVIVSRADPRLSLHRLLLDGKLTELRTAELAFTLSEAASIFELAGIELTADQVAALHGQTEGWAAGLRLAALSLEGHEDVGEVVRTFAGDDGAVADYFVEQVLQHASPEVRVFMLKTSVVDLMTPGMVEALLGQAVEPGHLLERLERSGAFVSRVGDSYRYHLMFRELLRSQLRHRIPEAFFLQHRRAARWYAQQGLNVMAIRHSIEARDWDVAANLATASWLGLLVSGDAATVTELVGRLPRRSFVRDPELALAAGAALLESGNREQAAEYIRLADRSASMVKSGRRAEFSFARVVTRQYEARATGDLESAIIASRKLLAGHRAEALALDGHERRALALLNLGAAETWARTRGQARSTLESALALARHGQSEYLVFCALASLGLLEALSGELRRSAEASREAVSLGERFGWMRLPPAAQATCALAICAYHWNATSDAIAHLKRADTAARGAPDRLVSATAQLMRALIAIRVGDGEAAGIAIRSAREEAVDSQLPPALAGAMASAEAEALIAAGRPDEAVAALEAFQENRRFGEGEVVKARLALAAGEPNDAANLATAALADKLDRLQPATDIELHTIAAVAAYQLGDDESALRLAENALELADTERYLSPFLASGAPLRELVLRSIRVGTSHRALAGELVETLDPHADEEQRGRITLMLEPLSAREKAVLRYLPTDLSKAEIAAELFVSVNTVKTHMKNIYRKLDVTDRAQAVRRARTLRIG